MNKNDSEPHPVETPVNQGSKAKFYYLGVVFSIIILAVLAIPILFPAKVRTISIQEVCLGVLRQIDQAKEQWALENKKTLTDTPTFDDLVGTDKYIKLMPPCPANGTYTIGNMVTKPICSIPDHTLP